MSTKSGEDHERVRILDLLDGYLAELRASGRGAEAEKRWTPGFKAFVKHLGHDDAKRNMV